MTVTTDETRDDSQLEVQRPTAGVDAEAMKAAIAVDLFGEEAESLQIGRYVVREALGEGGMGVVYSAWDPSLARQVALKLLSRGVSKDARRRARMVREAQALAKLSDPHVVQVYEVAEEDGDVFVAMELIDGPSLRDWLASEERSPSQILDVFIQAGRGLRAAHRAGLVHRDFKPTNVIVGNDGRVRVVDFGLAYGEGSSTDSAVPPASSSPIEKLTRTGAVLGTPAYMAPEQLRGAPADARADQFSFCVALFEAVTGSRPYNFVDLRDQPDTAKIIGWERVPRRWRAALQRGLSVGASERWPDLDELLRKLHHPHQRTRRAIPWLVVGGLGLFVWAPWNSLEHPCVDLPDAPGGWGQGKSSAIREAMLATGAPYAADVWESTEAELDAFSDAWTSERDKACRGEPRRDVVACLQRASVTFEGLAAELLAADASSIDSIHRLPALLSSPHACQDSPAGTFGGDIESSTLAALTSARAAVASNRFDEALALLDQLIEDPRLSGTDVLSEVYSLEGRSWAALANHAKASAAFGRSLVTPSSSLTLAHRYDDWLWYLISVEREQSARDALHIFESLVDDDSPPSLRAALLKARAMLPRDAALSVRVDQLERSERLYERAGYPREAANVRMVLANLLSEAEDPAALERAGRLYREELERRRETLGETHPETAVAMFNLATHVTDTLHDYEAGLELLEAVEAIESDVLPPESTARARTRLKIAEALTRLGRGEEADPYLDSAWSVLERLPPDHTDHIAGRTLLASVTLDRGQHEASLEHHRALAELQPDDAFVQQNIAYLSVQLGDARSAKQALARARALVLGSGLDDATLELLELYFRAVDAQIAHLEARPEAALAMIDEIEKDAAAYRVPEGRPDLEDQLQKLQPELDELRAQLAGE